MSDAVPSELGSAGKGPDRALEAQRELGVQVEESRKAVEALTVLAVANGADATKFDHLPEVWNPDDKRAVDLSKLDLKKDIKFLQWIKVKIVVNANQVDVYLDDTHALHYLIDTMGLAIDKQITLKDKDGKELTGSIKEFLSFGSYVAGGVGFRCAGEEHAHFRNVRVKPL